MTIVRLLLSSVRGQEGIGQHEIDHAFYLKAIGSIRMNGQQIPCCYQRKFSLKRALTDPTLKEQTVCTRD